MYMIPIRQVNRIFRSETLIASVFTNFALRSHALSLFECITRTLGMLVLSSIVLYFSIYANLTQADDSQMVTSTQEGNRLHHVLVMGDSLSAGYDMDLALSWPTLLQQRFDQSGFKARVINASISGQTSAEGLAQVETLLKQSNADLLILELGVNDGLRGLPIPQMKQNLAGIIQASLDSGTRVLLLGMHVPTNFGRRYGQMFHRSFQQLAEQYDIGRVPFMLETVATQTQYIQADGLHPTKEAQPLILEHLWPAIEQEMNKIK